MIVHSGVTLWAGSLDSRFSFEVVVEPFVPLTSLECMLVQNEVFGNDDQNETMKGDEVFGRLRRLPELLVMSRGANSLTYDLWRARLHVSPDGTRE